MNYYRVLGISPKADGATIKRAYHEIVKEYHPDINPDPHAAAILQRANHAYSILSDPEKRSLYDNQYQATPETTPQTDTGDYTVNNLNIYYLCLIGLALTLGILSFYSDIGKTLIRLCAGLISIFTFALAWQHRLKGLNTKNHKVTWVSQLIVILLSIIIFLLPRRIRNIIKDFDNEMKY